MSDLKPRFQGHDIIQCQVTQQEAQLSQRDRATLRVIEYHSIAR